MVVLRLGNVCVVFGLRMMRQNCNSHLIGLVDTTIHGVCRSIRDHPSDEGILRII
jgi:hypothetical protein